MMPLIRKWVKILPYFLVVRIIRDIVPRMWTFNGQTVYGWRIDKGEFLIWDQENYETLRQKEQERESREKEKRREQYEKLREEFEQGHPPEDDFDD